MLLTSTPAQFQTCFYSCQQVTALYVPINFIRRDEQDHRLVILAGEEIQIVIYPNGKRRIT